VYIYNGNGPLFLNCTVTGNSSNNGGGIYVQGSNSLRMRNCIVRGNSATDNPNIATQIPNLDITFSNIEGGLSGTGNINTNPIFLNASIHDYHLHPSSPCIDTGDPADTYGNEPLPNGGRINMGFYGNTPEATSFDPTTIIIDFSYTIGCGDTTEVTLLGLYFGNVQGSNGEIHAGNALIPSNNILQWSDTAAIFRMAAADVEGNEIVLVSDIGQSDTIPGTFMYSPFATYVSGDVSGVWTAGCPGTYILTGPVTIPATDTLVIEPGVVILVNTDSAGVAPFIVEGNLFASGTSLDSIIFSVLPHQARPGAWKGIELDMQNFNDEAVLSYCLIENAQTGVTIRDDDEIIEYCTIQKNSKHGVEWLAYGEYLDGQLRYCTVQDNNLWGVHCLAYTDDGSGNAVPTIANNEIKNNKKGGILIEGIAGSAYTGDPCTASANSNPIVLNNFIHHNLGHGIECYAKGEWTDGLTCNANYRGRANPRIEGNLIAYNDLSFKAKTVPADAQHWLAFSEPKITNCTFWQNGPTDIEAGDSAAITIANSIFWDGVPSVITTYGGGVVNISHSNFDLLYPGSGNLTADPLFGDPFNNDFYLTTTSPCIDAGDNAVVIEILDQKSNLRTLDGDGNGTATVDMGAIETTGPCSMNPMANWTGGTSQWSIPFEWDSGYVPNSCNDVAIPSGAVIVPAAWQAFAKSLDVQVGAIFEVKLGAILTVE
ncbi:MAG: right-handed parallel beta-helix repeat-containing protein, partial [Saprospiraceae bacterium]|nr:right-handed parallel beta-helix repeat-containing protein [Saprospiraceae bacterium]